MKLRLLVVGRMQADFAACEERFRKRLRTTCELQVLELAEGRGRQVAQRRQDEEKRILAQARPGFVLFDERGQPLSSRQWAAYLQQMPGNAVQDFVIGGADGVSDALRQKAGACWSLSPLTLPHQMARLLVVEQFYRAWSMLQGHPYHRA